MNQTPFPDNSVIEVIGNLAKKFNLQIINEVYTPSEKIDPLLKKSVTSMWEWTLMGDGSNVAIEISINFPSFAAMIKFSSIIQGTGAPSHRYFFFDKYLSKHLKATQDSRLIDEITQKKQWKERWAEVFELLEKHLAGELGRVLSGEIWPEIPFEWEDYLEREAIDRLQADVAKAVESPSGTQEKNGWVYFLDFFRSRKNKKD